MANTSPTALLEQALKSYGASYLEAENALRAGGAETAKALSAIAADQTQPPLARFVAAAIAAFSTDAGPHFDMADRALANQAKHAEKTPIGTPMADTAAAKLALFDDIADLVALRLLKETDWPEWKVMTAIVYLGFYATASVLPALEQFRADLKAGKRTGLGALADEQTNAVIEKLDQAADLVRIVIEDETFKTDLDKVKQSEGDKDAQTEAAKLAVAQAVSTLYGQPDNAQKIDQAIESLRAALVGPVLEATKGALNPDFVRGVLASYILGEENTSPPTAPDTDTQPKSD